MADIDIAGSTCVGQQLFVIVENDLETLVRTLTLLFGLVTDDDVCWTCALMHRIENVLARRLNGLLDERHAFQHGHCVSFTYLLEFVLPQQWQ